MSNNKNKTSKKIVIEIPKGRQRGKKFNDDVKELVFAEIASGGNMMEVCRKYDLAPSTVQTWITKSKGKDDDIAKLRTERKKDFVENAWKLIGDSMAVAQKRIYRAKDLEDNIDVVAEAIKKNAGAIEKETGIGWFDLLNLIRELQTLKSPKVSELSTLIGTMYDKQALANNEATEITKVKLEDFAE